MENLSSCHTLLTQLSALEWRHLRSHGDDWRFDSGPLMFRLEKLGLIELHLELSGESPDGGPANWDYTSRLTERGKLLVELAKQQPEIRQTIEVDALNSFLEQHQAIISKFLGIADRKVSVVDEYGDENWDALPAEVKLCVQKMRKADETAIVKGLVLSPDLEKALTEKFKAYHASKQYITKDAGIEKMSGIEFESFVAKLLKERGFSDVCGTPVTGDQGADLVVTSGSRRIVIQTKRWDCAVDNSAIQEVVAARAFYEGTEAWVITDSVFTTSAKALAAANRVKLIDGPNLQRIVDGEMASLSIGETELSTL